MKVKTAVNKPKVGVGIVVIKVAKGKSYLMLHQRKGSFGKNYWGSRGGHLELGESLQAGALRELEEEAGAQVKVRNVKFLGVVNFTQLQPKHFVDISFLAEWVEGEPTNNAPKETTDWKWFELDKLPKPLFPPLEKYLGSLKKLPQFHDSSFEL